MKRDLASLLRKPVLLLTGALLACGGLSSCSTTQGFGQDVQKVGNKIENEAARHS